MKEYLIYVTTLNYHSNNTSLFFSVFKCLSFVRQYLRESECHKKGKRELDKHLQ